jgi:tetratricopeptide (TPR) repeat protein
MHLRSSLAINDKNAITYYNYGNLLVDIDNTDEAINMYKKAIEIEPDFKEAKEELEKLL